MPFVRGIVLALFFFSVVFFAFSSSEMIFNSPDEHANAMFAWSFAELRELAIPSIFSQDWGVLVHPRSTVVVDQTIVPVSFVGLSVICGLFASVFGDSAILLITPILAVLAIMAWRQSIFYLFGQERLADLAAFFLMIHPAFWYYTGRTMMHNIGFVALLIIGFYFIVCRPFDVHWHKKWFVDEILAGVMVGLALAFRSSEVVWIMAIIGGLVIWKWQTVGWRRLIVFGVGFMIALIPFLALNNALYGAPWLTGYMMDSSIPLLTKEGVGEVAEAQGVATATDQALPGILGILFPFGIHEMNILRNVWHYGFVLYPWMSTLSILGILFVFKKKEWRSWLVMTLGLSLWMALVYGSWMFSDNPDASVVTLGNSYVRYWLPLFVFGSLFAAVGIDRITGWLEKQKMPFASAFLWVIVFVVSLLSIRLVAWGPDGFVQTHHNLEAFIQKKQIVLDYTSEDSIIVVDMADKYLFPDRQVVTPLRDETVYAYIPEMMNATDVYYFGITLPEGDIDYLENSVFEGKNIELQEVAMAGDETLYRLIH